MRGLRVTLTGASEHSLQAGSVVSRIHNTAKLHVFGDKLWANVASSFSSTVVAVGKSLFPVKLKDGHGINLSDCPIFITEQLQLSEVPPVISPTGTSGDTKTHSEDNGVDDCEDVINHLKSGELNRGRSGEGGGGRGGSRERESGTEGIVPGHVSINFPTEDNHGLQVPLQAENATLRINLELGTTKRTTLIKNLQKLPPSTG